MGWIDPKTWALGLPDPIEPLPMRDGDLLSIYYDPGDPSKRVRGIVASARQGEDGVVRVDLIRDPFDA